MSTTWVFIGLLGGREVAMAIRSAGDNSTATAFKLLLKDFKSIHINCDYLKNLIIRFLLRKEH